MTKKDRTYIIYILFETASKLKKSNLLRMNNVYCKKTNQVMKKFNHFLKQLDTQFAPN